MAKATCRACKALLQRRGARCRSCGWASDYGDFTERRERNRLVGISAIAVGLFVALAMAFSVQYFNSAG